MEEALHDMPLFREFAGLGWDSAASRRDHHPAVPPPAGEAQPGRQMLRVVNDLLRSKGLMLKTGTVVDATLIAAPVRPRTPSGERDPEMKQTKKGNQWYFGMKAHIGVDASRVWCTPWSARRPTSTTCRRPTALLHGEESTAFADAGYQGVHKRP
jgi:IS5 family transposase